MRNVFGFLFLSYFFTASFCFADDRGSSAPYITGDTFRAFADFIIDETEIPFFPEKVTHGSTIFVKTDYLEAFFSLSHPLIEAPYILISHNSDFPAPGTFAKWLDDPKIIAWFAQNVENFSHEKLHPIPIGIANRRWEHGNPYIFDQVRSELFRYPKQVLLYMNFSLQNCYSERSKVFILFEDEPYCLTSPVKALETYLIDIAESSFVLSPRGNGLDCHRTWEALYLGSYPIVRSSSLDPIFEGLPVVIVNEWEEVNESFLKKKREEFSQTSFHREKLEAGYWFSLIDSYRSQSH